MYILFTIFQKDNLDELYLWNAHTYAIRSWLLCNRFLQKRLSCSRSDSQASYNMKKGGAPDDGMKLPQGRLPGGKA